MKLVPELDTEIEWMGKMPDGRLWTMRSLAVHSRDGESLAALVYSVLRPQTVEETVGKNTVGKHVQQGG